MWVQQWTDPLMCLKPTWIVETLSNLSFGDLIRRWTESCGSLMHSGLLRRVPSDSPIDDWSFH
jgi:hypothetical protein